MSVKYQSRSPWFDELINAVGLDGKLVRGFTLDVQPDSAVTLDVIMYVENRELAEVVEVVKRYHLVALEPEPDPPAEPGS